MAKTSTFLVNIAETIESSDWIIHAEDRAQAAELYVAGVIDEEISAEFDPDPEDTVLRIWEIPAPGAAARVVGWDELEEARMSPAETDAWRDAVAKGWEPGEGWPLDDDMEP